MIPLVIILLLLLAAMWVTMSKRISELEEENRRLRAMVSNAIRPEPQVAEAAAKLESPLADPAEARSGQEWPLALPAEARGGQEWETILGGSILNKLGALVLVIGFALFLTYSYTRITPAGRAFISAALSLAILAAGVVVERQPKYRVFARGLIGAGWAGLYATSYAMYALPATRVIADPFVGALLQLLVAGAMIAHSLRYRAQAVTSVAYFSAFAALAATPSNSFAVMSLLPLAVSVLYLAWRFEWHAMALFGVLATYATCISRGNSDAPFYATASLFFVYWLVFEIFDLFRAEKRVAAVPLTLVFPLNAVAFVGLVENAWSRHAPHELWKMAAAMAVIFLASAFSRIWIVAPASLSGKDIVARLQRGSFEAPLTFSAALASFAIAGRVPGVWASISLAAEAELLYLAGVWFKSQFLRVLGCIGFAFSLSDLVWTGYRGSGRSFVLGFPLYKWTPAALVHALLFHVNRLVRRPNLAFSFLGSGLAGLVLIAEIRAPYDGLVLLAFSVVLLELGLRKHLIEFRVQAYLGTAAAVLVSHPERFWGMGTLIWIAVAGVAVAGYGVTGRLFRSQIWAAIAVLMVFAGCVTDRFFVAAVWGALLVVLLLRNTRKTGPVSSAPPEGLASSSPVWRRASVPFALLRNTRKTSPVSSAPPEGLASSSPVWRRASVPFGLLRNTRKTGPVSSAPPEGLASSSSVWRRASVPFALLIGKTSSWPDFKWQGLTIAALIFIRCLTVNLEDSSSIATLSRFIATLTAALCLYGAQFIQRGDKPYGSNFSACFSVLATIVLTGLLYREVSGSLLTVSWGVAAVVLLLAGFALRERTLRLEGLVLLLICILKLFLYDLRNLEIMSRILSFIALGVLLLAVSWLYTRFRENIKRFL